MAQKTVVGLIERIVVIGKNSNRKVKARIDTGAKSNSIDKKFANGLEIFPGKKTTIVKSSIGKAKRHVVMLNVEIAGQKMKGRFTLADRSMLKYPVLIGRNILRKGFIIDPSKK